MSNAEKDVKKRSRKVLASRLVKLSLKALGVVYGDVVEQARFMRFGNVPVLISNTRRKMRNWL